MLDINQDIHTGLQCVHFSCPLLINTAGDWFTSRAVPTVYILRSTVTVDAMQHNDLSDNDADPNTSFQLFSFIVHFQTK